MKAFTSGGKKDLTGKLPVDMVTLQMLEGITEGMVCGLKKGYEKHNWKKGVPLCEAHLSAVIRHIFKYMGGEDINVETAKDGSPIYTHHLDNAISHLAMVVHQIKSGRKDLDDRETVTKDETISATVLEAMAQVKQGNIIPLSFDLEDDIEWLEESPAAPSRFTSKHDWGFNVKRKD